MEPISVVICCANVADTLPAACASVRWADELVIVDSGSTDGTSDIAKASASRYVLEPWRGYTAQKRFGAGLCRHDWILLLDGDEECSPELAREIRGLSRTELDGADVFLMPRRNYMMRRYVRSWSPDWQSRFFHRHRCRWSDEALHDARLPSRPSRQGRLRGSLLHKRVSDAGFRDYFDGGRADSRIGLVADELYRRGRRCGWVDLWLRPLVAFLKFYVLKRGFLDGTFGLLTAQKAAMGTQLKYAALWARQQGPPKSDAAGA